MCCSGEELTFLLGPSRGTMIKVFFFKLSGNEEFSFSNWKKIKLTIYDLVDMFIVIGLIIVNNNEMTYKGIFLKIVALGFTVHDILAYHAFK